MAEMRGKDYINKSLAPEGIQVLGEVTEQQGHILTLQALRFLAELHRNFNMQRRELLASRQQRQKKINNGELPDFLPETEHIRKGNWKAAPLAPGLQDRRVEITGPVDRKMIINALNSGAKCFMADFEDSNSPTWENAVGGQVNMHDAIHRTIEFENPATGKKYKLNDKVATLLARPRGLHMDEKHILIDGEPLSGSLFDFGLYFYHNARKSLQIGQGPYFYIPKLESHLEARWWNNVFVFAQQAVGLPRGTIRATVLIETITAAFEMDEIIFELKEHSSGLNCGRWDYIFSFIKRLIEHKQFLLPNRSDVTMTTPFMDAYVRLLIKTCHRRGVHAMGGMAAQIPIKTDADANAKAMDKVTNDKLREVKAGHDGTWVAHPGLIPLAMKIFNEHMPNANQIDKQRDDVHVGQNDLLSTDFSGHLTLEGIKLNIDICLQYMGAWLGGMGCVPIHNLMEDAATAEISRAQLFQQIKYGVEVDGFKVTVDSVRQLIDENVAQTKQEMGEKFPATYERAAEVLKKMIGDEALDEFLTFPACYNIIVENTAGKA
eukprot:Clim_evm57s229 gene=Clim_evmTU57s229